MKHKNSNDDILMLWQNEPTIKKDGQSTKMSYQKELRFPAGSISLKMNIRDGNISECRIYGDFFEM